MEGWALFGEPPGSRSTSGWERQAGAQAGDRLPSAGQALPRPKSPWVSVCGRERMAWGSPSVWPATEQDADLGEGTQPGGCQGLEVAGGKELGAARGWNDMGAHWGLGPPRSPF